MQQICPISLHLASGYIFLGQNLAPSPGQNKATTSTANTQDMLFFSPVSLANILTAIPPSDIVMDFFNSAVLQFSECPANYDDVHREMSREGARVLALGYKEMGHLSHQQVRSVSVRVKCSVLLLCCKQRDKGARI